jgi:hypothetical protein
MMNRAKSLDLLLWLLTLATGFVVGLAMAKIQHLGLPGAKIFAVVGAVTADWAFLKYIARRPA